MPHRAAWLATTGFVLLLTSVACSSRDRAVEDRGASDASTASLLPMTIHGMPLVGVTKDAAAEAVIRRLHGKDVAPVASYVGRYEGGGGQATLYVSRFATAAAADSMLDRMEGSIGGGNQDFAHHTEMAIGELRVHAVLGQGLTHFFFARGTDLSWLAVARGMGRVGLADLLGITLDEMPEGLVLDGVAILPPLDSFYRRDMPRSHRGPSDPSMRAPGGR